MIPKTIYTYWEGNRYPYIDYCLETMRDRSGVELVVLDDKNCDKYINGSIDERYKQLSNIAQKVDCIRCAVLCNYGGMWCDADTIILKSLDGLFCSERDVLGVRWEHGNRMCNGYFFSKKDSYFLKSCINFINNDLKNNFKKYYNYSDGCYFGEHMFNNLLNSEIGKCNIDFIPLEVLIPVNFPFKGNIWNEQIKIESFLCDNTLAIALNNSQFRDNIKKANIEHLASRDNLLGSIFRYSGIKVDRIEKVTPTVEELRRHNLPDDYSPEHPLWRAVSYRNRYLKLVEAKKEKFNYE